MTIINLFVSNTVFENSKSVKEKKRKKRKTLINDKKIVILKKS